MAKTANEAASKSFGQRFASILLIVVIPILVSLVMIAAALQFILKVPVWQDAMNVVQHKSAVTSQNTTGTNKKQVQVVQLKTQVVTLQTRNNSLTSKLTKDSQALKKLQSEKTVLQQQLTKQLSEKSQAEKQAAVLKGMDPSAAAQVMAKLPPATGAAVVAVMQASDSGPILAQMPPATASKLLTLASKVQFPQASSATGTGSAGTSGTANTIG